MLFTRMSAIKPGWENAFRGDQEKLNSARREWLTAFKDNAINTVEMLERGLFKARQDPNPFLPSIGQFVDWCKQTANKKQLWSNFLGLIKQAPDRRNWHQFNAMLYWIYHDIGSHLVKRADEETLEKLFYDSLERAFELEANGYKFLHPEKLLDKPKKFVKADEKYVQMKLAEMRRGLS